MLNNKLGKSPESGIFSSILFDMVRPKKHLGQHFLTDQGIAHRITELIRYGKENTVIEIGPGKGILTSFLLSMDLKELILVEIDRESVIYLKENYGNGNFRIIEGDFLKTVIPDSMKGISIIGNFPYNISSQIFFRVLELKDRVQEVVCMVQKEVAQRILSPPGNKQYGILSVLLQTWFDISLAFHVRPGSFFPPPAVNSSVIRLERNGRTGMTCSEDLYARVIKSGFNQRRKVLSNSLSSILLHLGSESDRLGLRRRPEELSVEDFISLSTEIEKLQYQSKNLRT